MKTVTPLALLVSLFFAFHSTTAQDWPALRGGKGDGIASAGELTSGNVSLKVAWKKKLGSGYSSVSIADGRAYTMYSSGEDDKLGCFDIKNGETIWEFILDKRFKGENGSFDGPISTPLIYEGHVYGLSCQGRLVCVAVNSGELVWEKSLTESFEVEQPLYGFSTSPIIAAGNLILQVGAKDNMLVAMDPKSGAIKWGCGNDMINSQIPALVEVKGLPVLLASGAKNLIGVNPDSGEIVFEFEHGDGNGSAVMPVAIGDDNVLITVDDAFSKAVNLRPIDEQKIAASEVWQQRSIKNTYNVPTLCNGNLFAFSTRILTCVDPKTGKPRWKSRKPGDGFLIAFDNQIAVVTKEGSVCIVDGTAEKYSEIAKLKIFEDLVWTIPSFSDNAIFIRSLGELARVDIVSASQTTAFAKEAELPMSPAFAAFLKSVEAAENEELAAEIVDQYLASHESFPIVENGIAHFLYRGPETDVALACDVFGARQERKMQPVGKSDLKFFAMRLEPDQRANYVFLVDFKPQLDKLNDRKITSSMYAGEMEFAIRLRGEKPLEMSWFAMSKWKLPDHLASLPAKVSGEIVSRELPAEDGADPLPLDVYLPQGYTDATEDYPVIYVFPHMAFEQSQFIESADKLFADPESGIKPAIIVVPKGRPMPGLEVKLVEFIDKNYRTIKNRSQRSLVGFGFSGGTAIGAISSKPDLFGALSVQSPLIFGAGEVVPGLKKITQPTRVYLDWGRFDMHNPVENWDIRDASRELFQSLEANENVTVSGGEANDSVDWSSWKNRYDKVLRVLTPNTQP